MSLVHVTANAHSLPASCFYFGWWFTGPGAWERRAH